MPLPISSLLLFVLGFALQCNLYLAGMSRFLRATDLLILLLIPIFALASARRVPPAIIVFYVLVSSIVAFGVLFLAVAPTSGQYYGAFYLLFYAFLGLTIIYLPGFSKHGVQSLCAGMLYGFVVSVLVMYIDLKELFDLVPYGLAFPFDPKLALELGLSLRLEKAGGLWSHGNEAGPAMALACAAALHLSISRSNVWYIALFLCFFAWSFSMTLNRSGLIAVSIMLAIYLVKNVRHFDIAKVVWLILLLVGAIAIALSLGALDELLEVVDRRIANERYQDQNVSERLATFFAGLSIALQYPFGIGIGARASEMIVQTGIRTPHNGYLAVSYLNGFVMSLIMLFCTLKLMFTRVSILPYYRFSAFGFFVGFSFEELNLNPVFMFTGGVIIAVASVLIFGVRQKTKSTNGRERTMKYSRSTDQSRLRGMQSRVGPG